MKNGRFEVGDIVVGYPQNGYYGFGGDTVCIVENTYKFHRFYRMDLKVLYKPANQRWTTKRKFGVFNNTNRFRLMF